VPRFEVTPLNTKYFAGVTNKLSLVYCTVSGYNTGQGNVAAAITGQKNLKKAINAINQLTDKELYAKLIRDLPYEETKGYLKKVVDRMGLYQ
jgi:membrane-bound lytic murein transglycosylase C